MIRVCLLSHFASVSADGIISDGHAQFPDPFREGQYATTGLCRNVSASASPQARAKKILTKGESVYFLYYSPEWKNWGPSEVGDIITGLMKVTAVSDNHDAYLAKIAGKRTVPPNVFFRGRDFTKEYQSLAGKKDETKKLADDIAHYAKRSKFPYAEGRWVEVIPQTGLKIRGREMFWDRFSAGSKAARHSQWGLWGNFQSEETLMNWIRNVTK